MTRPSWLLDRRTLLKGAGVSLALPLLECMGDDVASQVRPKRFCAVYFPYGSVFLNAHADLANWNWTPSGEGSEFQFGEIHRSFEALRDDVTMLNGLSHPNGRAMGGHDTADIWLTGSEPDEEHDVDGSGHRESLREDDSVCLAGTLDRWRSRRADAFQHSVVRPPRPADSVAAPTATGV